ncbi:DUF3800 domain-containing protein [Palaeococcus sp. (in: euryarchaeotes)]
MPNVYIILDEAGDLGFSRNSSPYFVMAAVIIKAEDVKNAKRIPKKAREKLGKKKKDIPELKASKSSDKVKCFILDQLFKCQSAHIGAVYINKHNTYDYIRNNKSQKAKHYNYLAKVLIVDSLKSYLQTIGYSPEQSLTINVYLDRFHTTKFRKEDLNGYITKMITDELPYANVKVYQKNSQAEPLIQVADFVANAFYKKLTKDKDFLTKFQSSNRIVKFKQLY